MENKQKIICEDCKNELHPYDVELGTCGFCINKEARQENLKQLFKYPELIAAIEEWKFQPEYESGEYGHYEGMWYLENKLEGDCVEGIYPEDILKLYELIKKHSNR